jgi:hypothetical protein
MADAEKYAEMSERMMQNNTKVVSDQTGAGSKPWKRIARGGPDSRGGVRGSREAYFDEGKGTEECDGDEEGVGGNGTERNEVFRRRIGPRGSERSSMGS